jgi:hypothetical protein
VRQRVQIFVDAGLLHSVPTRVQLLQAELEMMPYVLSTDATSEGGYRDHLWSHPLVRQPLIFRHVGRDHLRTGSALAAKLESICAHLIVTFHQGMPVFDLQVIQTHPGGLDRLREAIDDTLSRRTELGRRRRRLASTLLADPEAYLAQFLGDGGFIARAARFDYPGPDVEGSEFPPEFYSLVHLLDYATTFPDARPSLRRAAHLVTRRFREGNGFGWFTRNSRAASAR